MKIRELTIYTKDISKQCTFYRDVLGFQLLEETSDRCTIKMGYTLLHFELGTHVVPVHYAVNIPFQMVSQARDWLEMRVPILGFEENEIIDFHRWEALALYFYDADNNIVEFIGRKRVKVPEITHTFSVNNILGISEMAIVSNDLEAIYKAICEQKEIPIFDGSFDRFCALGNDEGLFILVNNEKKRWFPTNDEALQADFIIKGDFNFKYMQGKLRAL